MLFDVSTGWPRWITTQLVTLTWTHLYQENLTPDYISNWIKNIS